MEGIVPWQAGFVLALSVIVAYFAWREGQCPMRIKGYRCQGEDCDHSKEAIDRARKDMER